MVDQKKEVAVPEQKIDVPANIIGGGRRIEGMEETDSEDIRIPRIKLLQGSSDEIKNPDEYPDLRVGMVINSLSHEELLKEGKLYPFIPVKMFKSWMKFNPYNTDDEGFNKDYKPGDLIFKTYDSADPFTKSENAWKYKQINFLGFQPGAPLKPIFVTFGSMSRPTGASIINIVQLAGRPLWEHLFLLGSKSEERNGNTFQVFTAKSEGKPADGLISIGRKMYEEFNPLLVDMKRSKVSIDETLSEDVPF